MKTSRIIWHHSAADSPTPQFDAINQWHKERTFPLSSLGFYVGYHYVIEKDGTVKQARENMDSIGICLVGDFTVSRPTLAQEKSFASLLRKLMLAYNISVNSIEPHRRDDSTECPGKSMPENWALGLL
jgi:hypothetical protein